MCSPEKDASRESKEPVTPRESKRTEETMFPRTPGHEREKAARERAKIDAWLTGVEGDEVKK